MFGLASFSLAPFGGAAAAGENGGGVADAVPAVAWSAQTLSWLIPQFQGLPKMQGIALAVARTVQRIEQALADLRQRRYLETASGAQLDEVGRRFGRTREAGLSDSAFRVELQALARAVAGSGTSEDLIAVFQVLGQGVHRFRLTEGTAEAIFDLLTQSQPGEGRRWAKVGRRAVPAGTRYFLRYQVSGVTPLRWSDDALFDGVAFPEHESGATVALAEADEGR
ncbi:MAG: hypothetical protein AAFN74_05235 [Myxococcota bacterium]